MTEAEFFQGQAQQCRDAAAHKAGKDRAVLMQLGSYYEKQAMKLRRQPPLPGGARRVQTRI